MAADDIWYFTKQQIYDTPSRKCGVDENTELRYRQQVANFIEEVGQKLEVSEHSINTAIVFMHRFYMIHSLSTFCGSGVAAVALFFAANLRNPRLKKEHVFSVARTCINGHLTFDPKAEQQVEYIMLNIDELQLNVLFREAVDLPHIHISNCCGMVKASKELAQISYIVASNTLHLSTMCLLYRPTVLACFCIHLASKWSNWKILKSNEERDWFYYVDKTVTTNLLNQITDEFLNIYDKSSSKLKQVIKTQMIQQQRHQNEKICKKIEKPLSVPVPRAMLIKEQFARMMIKKSHQPDYMLPSPQPMQQPPCQPPLMPVNNGISRMTTMPVKRCLADSAEIAPPPKKVKMAEVVTLMPWKLIAIDLLDLPVKKDQRLPNSSVHNVKAILQESLSMTAKTSNSDTDINKIKKAD